MHGVLRLQRKEKEKKKKGEKEKGKEKEKEKMNIYFESLGTKMTYLYKFKQPVHFTKINTSSISKYYNLERDLIHSRMNLVYSFVQIIT